jgi:hypothetical protein
MLAQTKGERQTRHLPDNIGAFEGAKKGTHA